VRRGIASHGTARNEERDMAVNRGLVIHFMDGSSVKLEIPKQVKSDESIVPRLEKILERQVLMAEVDGALMLVPFNNVKYMQVYPAPERLPDYALREAKSGD
jgi:hypothetical protein